MKLGPRERDIAALICKGWANPAISAHLGITIQTVKSYVTKLCLRFGVESRSGNPCRVRLIRAIYKRSALWRELQSSMVDVTVQAKKKTSSNSFPKVLQTKKSRTSSISARIQ